MPAKRIPGPVGRATFVSADNAKYLPQGPETKPLGVAHSFQRDRALYGSFAPAGTGLASVMRIPVPDIEDVTGKRVLRLDYGYNKVIGKVDYHWNQKGTFAEFGIADHTAADNGAKALYSVAKTFRYAGRVLLVVGVAMDVYSIVVAKRRWRQVARVAAGWGAATAGCEYVGGWGAGIGSAEPGFGTAVGGLVGCAVGGVAGYTGATWAAGEVYDWIGEEWFEPVPESIPNQPGIENNDSRQQTIEPLRRPS